MIGDFPIENWRRVCKGEPNVEDAPSHSFSRPFDSLPFRCVLFWRQFVKIHVLFIRVIFLHRVCIFLLVALQILIFRLPQMRLHRAQSSRNINHSFKPELLQQYSIHFLSTRAKICRRFRHYHPTFSNLFWCHFQHLMYAMRPNIFLQLTVG